MINETRPYETALCVAGTRLGKEKFQAEVLNKPMDESRVSLVADVLSYTYNLDPTETRADLEFVVGNKVARLVADMQER